VNDPTPPDRRTLLELDALLEELEQLADAGSRSRYEDDAHYRWVIHRLWIAVGNEAAALGPGHSPTQPWSDLRKLRNELAHQRLPDIDEDKVWRMTVLRPRALRTLLRELWR
jgi:uncharacterized protein with HEPN domain